MIVLMATIDPTNEETYLVMITITDLVKTTDLAIKMNINSNDPRNIAMVSGSRGG